MNDREKNLLTWLRWVMRSDTKCLPVVTQGRYHSDDIWGKRVDMLIVDDPLKLRVLQGGKK